MCFNCTDKKGIIRKRHWTTNKWNIRWITDPSEIDPFQWVRAISVNKHHTNSLIIDNEITYSFVESRLGSKINHSSTTISRSINMPPSQ